MATKKAVLDTHNLVTATELYNVLNLQLDAIDNDPHVVTTLPPLLVHGSPGCGKSSVVRSVCDDRIGALCAARGIDFVDCRLAQMEPADIKGLPVPNRERNVMDWFVNGTWPRDPMIKFNPIYDDKGDVKGYEAKAIGESKPKVVDFSYKNGTLKFKISTQGVKFANGRISVKIDDEEHRNDKSLEFVRLQGKTYEGSVETSAPVQVDVHTSGIIFLDEITSADRSIQVAAYELVLDRRLGKLYQVPPGYLIVAAGNNTTDKAVATTMSSALANRFMHVELKEDAEAWLTWARNSNIHPAVIGFITYKPGQLFNMEGENLERGWPSPRSWERVSQMCHVYKDSKDTLLRKMVYGLVGNGSGVEFMEFYKINAEFDNVLDYMLNPKSDIKKIIPDQADRKYALCSAMVYLLWRGKDAKEEQLRIDGFYRICCELTSDFASMALLASIQAKDKMVTKDHADKLLKHPRFKEWKAKHGAALKKGLDFSKIF